MKPTDDILTAISANPTFAYYVIRIITKGADLGECVRVAKDVTDGEQWYQRWHNAARTWEGRAEEALGKGRSATARDAFVQASFYYRAAEFFLPGKDERKIPTYMKNNECFEKAGKFFIPPLRRVSVPYEGTTLPSYLYLPQNGSGRHPAVVFVGGADDCKEELHFSAPVEMITARGLACLTFDGPGKGETLRLKKLPTRPDFEKVVTAAIDFLEKCPEVDAERIGLVGISMGGYFAPRGAAYDQRVKACVSWSGLYDAGTGLFDYFPPIREQLRYILGAQDLKEAREKLKEFTLRDCIKKIQCPYLIVHGGNDSIIPVSEARRVYEEARCPKELKIWEEALHVCNDYSAEVRPFIWDWIAEKLR